MNEWIFLKEGDQIQGSEGGSNENSSENNVGDVSFVESVQDLSSIEEKLDQIQVINTAGVLILALIVCYLIFVDLLGVK